MRIPPPRQVADDAHEPIDGATVARLFISLPVRAMNVTQRRWTLFTQGMRTGGPLHGGDFQHRPSDGYHMNITFSWVRYTNLNRDENLPELLNRSDCDGCHTVYR